MRLLAIDPGNEESALLVYDTDARVPTWWRKLPNDEALHVITATASRQMHVEMIASYGMSVGASVFDTCVWIGRFIERWKSSGVGRSWGVDQVYRREVKLHLCNSVKARDANVRQALIDRYGGNEKAIGKKATPGPLYGLKSDCWAALAVAVTVAEREP